MYLSKTTCLNNICKYIFINNVCKSLVIKVDHTHISNSFLARYRAFLSDRHERLVKTNHICVELAYKNESFYLFHTYFTVKM